MRSLEFTVRRAINTLFTIRADDNKGWWVNPSPAPPKAFEATFPSSLNYSRGKSIKLTLTRRYRTYFILVIINAKSDSDALLRASQIANGENNLDTKYVIIPTYTMGLNPPEIILPLSPSYLIYERFDLFCSGSHWTSYSTMQFMITDNDSLREDDKGLIPDSALYSQLFA